MAKKPRSKHEEEIKQTTFPPAKRRGFFSTLFNPLGLFRKKSKPQNDHIDEDLDTLEEWSDVWDEDSDNQNNIWNDDDDDNNPLPPRGTPTPLPESSVPVKENKGKKSSRPQHKPSHKAGHTSDKATRLLVNILVIMILLLVGMAVFVLYTLMTSGDKSSNISSNPVISHENASRLSTDLESRLGAYQGRTSVPAQNSSQSASNKSLPSDLDLGYTTEKDDILRGTDLPDGIPDTTDKEKPSQPKTLTNDSFANLWGRGQDPLTSSKPTGQPLWRENAAVSPVGIEGKSQIAIILDDDPSSKSDTVALVGSLKFPVTVGVYASVIGEQSVIDAVRKDRKHDVILNIPMEDKSVANVGYEPILSDLSAEEVKRRMTWHLNQLTGYIGIKNHLGGAITNNTQSIASALSEPMKKGLLFLDMRVTPESIGSSVASKIGMPNLERDVWLSPPAGSSNLDIDPVKLAKNLELLEKKAKRYGFAVGVGVATPAVVSALKEWSERVSDKEIVFVPLSSMMKAKQSLAQ